MADSPGRQRSRCGVPLPFSHKPKCLIALHGTSSFRLMTRLRPPSSRRVIPRDPSSPELNDTKEKHQPSQYVIKITHERGPLSYQRLRPNTQSPFRKNDIGKGIRGHLTIARCLISSSPLQGLVSNECSLLISSSRGSFPSPFVSRLSSGASFPLPSVSFATPCARLSIAPLALSRPFVRLSSSVVLTIMPRVLHVGKVVHASPGRF
jgi:hypothetical protein